MLVHTLDGLPLEACGLFAGTVDADTGEATVHRFYPCENEAASSKVYTVPAIALLRSERDAEDNDWQLLGVMHSHTHTDAYPSPTDVRQAPDPEWHYVIVSTRDDQPMLRSFRIVEGSDRRRTGRRHPLNPQVVTCPEFRRAVRFPTIQVRNMTVFASALDLIGNTPIVDVSQLSPNPEVRILAKMEGQNPAGSVKDRIALSMIEEAEADGTLVPGKTIIEPSSGNTGIALAMISRIKGYKIKIVLPGNVSIERRQLLEVYGAEIIDSPGEEGSNGAVRMALALAEEHPDWVFLYQYGNESNPRAHYRTTGPEIFRDVPEITHFVAGLGTSGTLLGVGTYLKEKNPDIQILAVEPPSGEQVEGLRSLDDGYIPPVFEKWGGYDLLNGKSIVRPRESLEYTRKLMDVGIFSGISAGAALAGAAKVAKRIESGVIVFVVCDYGWKYLSTGAWTLDLDEATANAEKVIYF